jgi:hypothetical protein
MLGAEECILNATAVRLITWLVVVTRNKSWMNRCVLNIIEVFRLVVPHGYVRLDSISLSFEQLGGDILWIV